MNCDFHCHSYYSDGELTPEEVVNIAHQRQIECLALTDHDTTAGVGEAQQAAEKHGIRLVPGTEISALWRGKDIHIVALNIDLNNEVLQQGLTSHQNMRISRAKQMGQQLADLGIEGAFEGALQLAGMGLVARPHFAKFLIEQGHCKDFATAFQRYLKRGKPGYVKTPWTEYNEVVQWIKNAGGLAILAHPCRYKLTSTQLHHLLRDFVAAGGDGVEVVTSTHTQQNTQMMAKLADDYNLLASRGSDFHGPSTRAKLGELAELPSSCKPIWSELVP